jgi:hypothetical protein
VAAIELEIRGLPELYRKFGTMAAQETLLAPMWRAVYLIQEKMADYPPAPSGSRYQRTSVLGKSWTANVTQPNGGVQGKVGNKVLYGPFVQSSVFQAWMHRGRWQTDEQVLRAALPGIEKDFEAVVAAALG